MTARRVVLFLALSLATVTGLARADLGVRKPNATADDLQRLGLRFGLDFNLDDRGAPHPTAADARAASSTGYFAWLNSELARPDDAISDPPAAFRDYIQERHAALWEVVSTLEKGSPDWGEKRGDELWAFRTLLPTIQLERMLLSVALSEEHDGEAIAASRALEASWSLGRPAVEGEYLIHQLLGVGIAKLQAGTLRKIHAPSIAWMNRLSGEAPWTRMLDSVERESKPASGLEEDAVTKALRRLHRAVAANFRRLSPCDASRQTDDEVWRAVAGEVQNDPSPAVRSSAEEPPPTPTPEPGAAPSEPPEEQRFYFQRSLSDVTKAVRRGARLAVDRELTLKILELRMEAEASKDRKWPATLADTFSHVCPGASYPYRRDGDGMEVRFDGTIDSGGGEPVLPLAFHTGEKARATPMPVLSAVPNPGKP